MMDFTDAALEVISQVSAFMRFFVPGYIFISCFDFTACMNKEEKVEILLIKSVTFSFILTSILDFLKTIDISGKNLQTLKGNYFLQLFYGLVAWAQAHEILFLLAGAFLSGFILGKIAGLKCIQKLIVLIFRRDTSDNVFTYIWRNIGKGKVVAAKFSLKEHPDYIYEGQIEKISTIYNDPIIIFRYYKCEKADIDLSDIDQGRMIVPYSNIDTFEILIDE